MVKRSKIGKRSKKRHTKKRNKRYSRKKTLKGGRLTPRQLELLRKVKKRNNFCRKKNWLKDRTREQCREKEPVCKWEFDPEEGKERCMKDIDNIREMYYSKNNQYDDQRPIFPPPPPNNKLTNSDLNIISEVEHAHTDTTEGAIDPDVRSWIEGRDQYESRFKKDSWKMHCYSELPSEECIYFDPQANINIVMDVLRREAKPESNVYLHLDSAHGALVNREIRLNNNLHLILIPARGHVDMGSRENEEKVMMLSIMKEYLDKGHKDLFNKKGCMTLNGSLLFYSLACRGIGIKEIELIMGNIHKETNGGNVIKLSRVLKIINDQLMMAGLGGSPAIRILKILLFRILKLYNPNERVNDTIFKVGDEEDERKKDPGSNMWALNNARWGITILYTNNSDENKYIHLPLDEIKQKAGGDIYLSQIIKYLKPLEGLEQKFFMKHGSCRVDNEYYRNKSSNSIRPTIYKPDLSSLTRMMSTPKEMAQKDCFIDYFRESQRREVSDFLSAYPTLIDYYVWLETKPPRAVEQPTGWMKKVSVKYPGQPNFYFHEETKETRWEDPEVAAPLEANYLSIYINILMKYGEGSSELYEFIMENH